MAPRTDRFLARSLVRPVNRFLQIEASGGILLAVAAVIALVWANSPWSAAYRDLWTSELTIDLAGHVISQDLRHWVNDGLMTLFFFVIGLEIKQELANGQLASPRDAAVPIAGALGGMVVPALLYVGCNLGADGIGGWGIPMATDVAFAVGVLALLGRRVPGELKVLLLGLAIVDDVGAIVVIAAVYSDGLDGGWLAAAGAGLLLVVLLRLARIRFLPVYVLLGSAIWLATFESGVHATIAGVALGLLTPARAPLPSSIPVSERLQAFLHPWTSYLIVPVFALANAGVALSGGSLRDAAGSTITLGVVVGLVLGKVVGVTGGIAIVTRLGVGRLPTTVSRRHILGMASLAGIGFTVSIFVAGLAFDEPAATEQATIGVLGASIIAAAIGSLILLRSAPPIRAPRS